MYSIFYSLHNNTYSNYVNNYNCNEIANIMYKCIKHKI